MNMTDKQIEIVRELILKYKDNPCRIFRERTRIEINYCSKTFFNFYYGLKVVRDEM